ncbi:MAG: hypothetical protein HC825_07720 [Oscillatoriales cyanobacterium RM1_1_9]|nr:hypothetical protein [Oscillatoriales cyanobacterium SM2_3_0]NJO47676.1 hypothetical protein [Oscillatoriales cyanobacterium RM2_1_1]NJO71595.1 hypothetical protein [Oscillatoriales cyanobacterium RM1_1_9]
MTIESVFTQILDSRDGIVFGMVIAPWLTWFICFLIPGYREEPLILSINLWLALLTMMLWAGYLAYTTNSGGWPQVVDQADLLLLVAPPYYLLTSLWISQRRIPLEWIPAFRTWKGLIMVTGAFLLLSWMLSRTRIVLFASIPFSHFLGIMALILLIGYWAEMLNLDIKLHI